jgi:hypothetical protein
MTPKALDFMKIVYHAYKNYTHGPIFTMEYYSAIKRNELPTHATTWVDLENIVHKKPDTKGHILYGPFV